MFYNKIERLEIVLQIINKLKNFQFFQENGFLEGGMALIEI